MHGLSMRGCGELVGVSSERLWLVYLLIVISSSDHDPLRFSA